MVAIDVQGLSKSFNEKKVLQSVSLSIKHGEMVALIGASGSGKSTLLRHISGLIRADASPSHIQVLGKVMQKDGKIGRGVRKTRSEVGVIFQQFNLVNRLSVLTNVLMGYLGQISRWRGALCLFSHQEKQRAMEALHRVGIDHLAQQRSSTLSGGQQQRAAIARTITQGAQVILADEPIASLDPASSRKVMETLKRVNAEDGVSVLVSLHQVDYAIQYCPRTIALRDGQVVFDGPSEQLTHDFLKELYGDHSLELYGKVTEAPDPTEDLYPQEASALALAE